NGSRVTVIDPSRANSSREEEGVYFTYPSSSETPAPRPQGGREYGGLTWTRPYIGVTIDGDHAFATLYSTKRTREAPGPGEMPDPLLGTTRLVCINLRTQQVLWDTDFGEPAAQMRKLDFWDRNFAFSGPPLVRGDRVYAGVGTSPIREEESRVLCLDRRTGLPVWQRFLASVNNFRHRGGYSASLVSRLTVLEEDRGVLIAHSNIGAIAALDAVTGQVRWLSKYPRTNLGGQEMGYAQIFSRPASPLVIHRGRIYALAQDAADLLIVDLATGAVQKEAPKVEIMLVNRPWKEFHRMVGRMGDYLVFGGAAASQDSCILHTVSGSTYGLTLTPTAGTGRGMIDGETLYLPHLNDGRGGLGIYHGQRHWQAFERSTLWWPLGEGGKGEGGNILRAGNYLVLASATRISLITDVEVVRAEYRRRLEQSPPNPAAWLDYGMLMRTNERWSEAARGYLNFIESVQGDAEWMGRAREVRTELHGIFLKLGHEAGGRKLPVDAAAHYKSARDFAWDGPTMSEATRLLAGACETVAETQSDPADRRSWARRAVEEYQELIRRSPPGFVKPADAMFWVPIRRLASTRIAGLLKRHGPEAYAGVARAADEELKRAGKDPAALRKMAEAFPDSPAALEALNRLADQAASQGRWNAAASTLRDMRFRLGDQWTPAQQIRLHETLEKAGDAERLEAELLRMEKLFKGSQRIGPDESSATVTEYLAKARPAAAALARRPAEAPVGSTATLSSWEAPIPPNGAFQLPVGWDLVAPGGLEPAKWSADLEFLSRGSSIELWNIRTKKRSWSAPHPGGWTGILYSEGVGGTMVAEVVDDSPAAKAGIKPGDIIRTIDGAPVTEENFDLATEGRAPGSKLVVDIKRGDESTRVELVPVAWPANYRPGIVGAIFTGEGTIVVAWEDLVAAFDLADGRQVWVNRPCRSRFVIRAVHGAADRILVHEHLVTDHLRSSFRVLGRQAAIAIPPEDQHGRIHGIDETDGSSVWAMGIRFDVATAVHHSIQFVGRPLDTHVGLLVSGFQGNVRVVDFIPVAVEDGKEGGRIGLSPSGGQQAPVWTLEPSTGTLWVIDSPMGGRLRLRGFTRPDYSPRGVEIALETYLDPQATGFSLASNADRVAVVSIGRQPGTPRFAMFSTRDGSLVAAHKVNEGPLKDRLMPGMAPPFERRMLPGLLAIEPDGRLLVYNEAKSASATTQRRATLTALSVAEGAFKIDWD
ncbi:MAG TPA: PQQ-binding-like beta-propeller repeat protein, partial [Planctomycetota bacterium]|nr:PQQ-binding-like beta-propeller repeat protein [Planctomycetota bacterium]